MTKSQKLIILAAATFSVLGVRLCNPSAAYCLQCRAFSCIVGSPHNCGYGCICAGDWPGMGVCRQIATQKTFQTD